jgi:hypothetical protein
MKAKIGPGMLKGLGALKGSGGKPKLARKKRTRTISTSMYRQGKGTYK